MEPRVLLCLCHMSGKEMDYIHQAFEENWVVPLGPNVDGFEKDLDSFLLDNRDGQIFQDLDLKISKEENLFRKKKTVALSSGTAAIHMGLVGCDVQRGDEVIVQDFTFSASANPVVYQGATPVFVDSEPQTWNISPILLERAIEDRIKVTGKKPKAIIPVCLYGMPVKYKEILEIASRWEIPIVEDAAEAFGSSYHGQMCGTFGLYGALSFNGNKMITTSGGGALVCEDEASRKKILKYATQSREAYPWYEHTQVGYNYRMSNISAGIGRGQMTIAEEHINHHRWVQSTYRELFKDQPWIELHENPDSNFHSNFWLCTVTFAEGLKVKDDDGCGVPEAIRRRLENYNIESRHLWKPMHLQPYFREDPSYIDGTSESLFKKGLCLPSGPLVGEKELDKIADIIINSIA